MRIEQTSVYPLEGLLASIPDEGLHLNKESLAKIALFFNSGGVLCETFEEVIQVLALLEEWTGLVELDSTKEKSLLRKKYNGNR